MQSMEGRPKQPLSFAFPKRPFHHCSFQTKLSLLKAMTMPGVMYTLGNCSDHAFVTYGLSGKTL